jgi:lysophospholipase L1-like esterase
VFSNWADRSDGGRKFWWRHQDGDLIRSEDAFTSSVNQNQSPIWGVQYLSRGKVVSVAGVGDSITEGRGTFKGEGFVLPALEKLNSSDSNALKYEYANYGWSGQNPSSYSRRAISLLQSDLKPDVIVLPTGSPNPASAGVLTQEALSAIRTEQEEMIDSARTNGVVPVLWTWLPTNAIVRDYGASDAIRIAYNAELLERDDSLLIVDAAAAVSGPVVNGQVQLAEAATTDGIHPNDAGNAMISSIMEPALGTAGQASLGQ